MTSVVAAAATAAVWLFVAAPWSGGAPAQRLGVVVADAENETDDESLRTLSGLLETSLQESRRLQVFTRGYLFDLLRRTGRPGVSRLDSAAAREAARLAGARALLVLTVRRYGDTYALDVEGLDPRSHDRMFAMGERGEGKSSVPSAVEHLAAKVRDELDAREGVGAAPVQPVTLNLEAYRHFYEGRECFDRRSRAREADCAVHFQRALAEDPDFALAHYELARDVADEGASIEEQRTALGPALRGLDRLPTKERELVLAWAAHVAGDDDLAMATYRRAAEAHPEDKRIAYLAGDLEFHRGRLAESVAWFEQVLDLDAEYEFALDHVVRALALVGDTARLSALAKRWTTLPPSAGVLHALSDARGWQGDAAGALAAAERAVELGANRAATSHVSRAQLAMGDLAAAEATLREDVAAAAPTQRLRLRTRLAAVLVQQGRLREARRELEEAAASTDDPTERGIALLRRAHLLAGRRDLASVSRDVAVLTQIDPALAGELSIDLAYAGDPDRAATVARLLPASSATLRLNDAVAMLRRGDPRAAAPRLRELARPAEILDPAFPPDAPAFLLGEALAEAGEHAEALAALRAFQRMYVTTWWRSWAFPRSQLLVARSLSRLGRTAEARDEAELLLASLSGADADDPLLGEARALRASLERAERP